MLGITFEGGASRTVYSCGIMDALLENDIMADIGFGVSAGAAFGVSYFSKQIGRNYKLATQIMNRRQYMGARNLLDPKNRCYYGLEYAYDTVPNSILPFDYDAFTANKGEFYAVVTNVQTGEAEYIRETGEDKQWTLLRATCALPLLFPMIEIGGKKYMDGGLADSIPYKQTIQRGCDKNIVVLTRPLGYVKKTDALTKLAAKHYRKYPNLCKAMLTRAQRYNECVSEIMQLKSQGKLFVFTPRSTFGVGRTENDPQKLKRLYEHGYKHAQWAMNDLKKYLNR
ncbi:MAG: patatin family protein [Ruminococcus sp.]|jgi:predicted patatin/cPLA2 family phospholipase|nr:patatin family protein [Ruminococcus sp.]MBQ3937163.1 patatin family protein [Ruminococcus sp.]MBQ9869912.1 patatin family protein [Ruminococcus sp.]MCR5480025.1 patatin family protein [Ruminococcus sp.]